jgi:signal transduction histidine kinase
MSIARGVIEDARVPAASKQIELSLTGPASAVCSLDEPTVRRAVANLVDNAIRYAPAGSAVGVEVDSDDTRASVAVTDHGAGIPSDQLEHIFERFWRGRRDASGTGLGLPIARQIALANGGDLTVTSPGPAGDGCVFRVGLRR